MKILFHSEQLSERGTTTAILEYAQYLKDIGFQCSIAYQKNHAMNNRKMIEFVQNKFEIIPYVYFWRIKRLEKKFDIGYFIKSGANNNQMFDTTPSIIHAVFQEYDPHGDLYLYVSEWLAQTMRVKAKRGKHQNNHRCRTRNCQQFDFLDHAVELPEAKTNLRSKLGIRKDDIVGVRYGGRETFDIPWVKETICQIVKDSPNIKFVFANTDRFITHPNVFFLDTIVDNQDKADFLNTGNFFIHARRQGESFGLAILEAIRSTIPVIAYSGGEDHNHVNLVPPELLYSNPILLRKMIYEREYRNHNDFFEKISSKYRRHIVGAKLERYINQLILS